VGSPPNGFYALTGDGPAPLDSTTPPAHDCWLGSGYGSREVLSRYVPRLEAIQPPTGSVFVRTISLSSRTRTVFVSHTLAHQLASTYEMHVNSHTDARTHKQTHAHANGRLVLCRYVGELRDPPPFHRTTTAPTSWQTPFVFIRHSSVDIAARSSLSDPFPSFYGSRCSRIGHRQHCVTISV